MTMSVILCHITQAFSLVGCDNFFTCHVAHTLLIGCDNFILCHIAHVLLIGFGTLTMFGKNSHTS